jgi:hypothetical protein
MGLRPGSPSLVAVNVRKASVFRPAAISGNGLAGITAGGGDARCAWFTKLKWSANENGPGSSPGPLAPAARGIAFDRAVTKVLTAKKD